jgi:hypothetical protein
MSACSNSAKASIPDSNNFDIGASLPLTVEYPWSRLVTSLVDHISESIRGTLLAS